jgi:thioredoxin reductase (NADPH)
LCVSVLGYSGIENRGNMQEGETLYDIIIIGGGPAGLSAGIYASRAMHKTLMIESMAVIGQLTMTDKIENYPGIDSSGGFDLIAIMKKQAESFGLESKFGTVEGITVNDGENEDNIFCVNTDSGSFKTLSVVLASGARPKKLGVPGEDEFLSKGISYCATCDGAFFRDKIIVVIGGGDTAIEEAIFLTKFGSSVTVVHRRDRLRAVKIIQDRAFGNEKIDFVWDSVVKEIRGEEKVADIVLENIKNGEISDLSCDGVFIFAGWTPNTSFVTDLVNVNERGSIIVDRGMNTSHKGVFACGDCCDGPLQQVVTACGDGAVAATASGRYVEELKGTAYV